MRFVSMRDGGSYSGDQSRLTVFPWLAGWQDRFFNTEFEGEATEHTEPGGGVLGLVFPFLWRTGQWALRARYEAPWSRLQTPC